MGRKVRGACEKVKAKTEENGFAALSTDPSWPHAPDLSPQIDAKLAMVIAASATLSEPRKHGLLRERLSPGSEAPAFLFKLPKLVASANGQLARQIVANQP